MPVTVFKQNQHLNNFYNITSTYQLSGIDYVATFEARSGAPIFAVIWHPEKLWEWKENVSSNKDIENAKATKEIAERFVDLARRSKHRFLNANLLNNNLIYNYLAIDPNSVMHNSVYFMKLTKNSIIGSASEMEGPVALEEEEAS
jgi:hypothetical protein